MTPHTKRIVSVYLDGKKVTINHLERDSMGDSWRVGSKSTRTYGSEEKAEHMARCYASNGFKSSMVTVTDSAIQYYPYSEFDRIPEAWPVSLIRLDGKRFQNV